MRLPQGFNNPVIQKWAEDAAALFNGYIAGGVRGNKAILPTKGGTGLVNYAAGDLLYASEANVLAKLPKGTVGQVMTMGAALPTWAAPAAAGAWEIVFDYTVEAVVDGGTGPVTSVTASGLDGNTDEIYKIEAHVVGAAPVQIDIQPNADTTVGVYFYQYLFAAATAVSGARNTSSTGLFGVNVGTAGAVSAMSATLFAKSGKNRIAEIRTLRTGNSASASYLVAHTGWSNTADNITSLKWAANVASAIDVGSRFMIWKKAA